MESIVKRLHTKNLNGALCEYDSQEQVLTIRIKFKRGEGYSALSSSGKTVLKADPSGLKPVSITSDIMDIEGFDKSGFGFSLKAWSKEGVSEQAHKEEKAAGHPIEKKESFKRKIARGFQEAETRGFEVGVKAAVGEIDESELPEESLTLRHLVSKVADFVSGGYGSENAPVSMSCGSREELPF